MPSRTSARLLQLEDGLAGQQRRGAGRERDLHALVGGVADQLEDILALQRVAAGKDEDRHVHRRRSGRSAPCPRRVVSSSGWAMGWAAARQCLQARSQDCVTSQMARNGVSSKFNPPRAGILCIGCMRPPAESRQSRPRKKTLQRGNATIPLQKNSHRAGRAVIEITLSRLIGQLQPWPDRLAIPQSAIFATPGNVRSECDRLYEQDTDCRQRSCPVIRL